MFKWKKLGLVFDPRQHRNGTWLNEFAQAPSTLILDDVVRVYFSCRPQPDEQGMYVSYSSYVDLDRHELFKIIKVADNPILPLGERGTFDEFGIYPVSVMRDGNRVLAYYTGHTRCESVPFDTAIGLAISTDEGATFIKAGSGPVLAATPFEPFAISSPKIRKFNDIYYLFYICGKEWLERDGKVELVYKIRMATSPDGLKWTKLNRDIISDRLENEETQAGPDVFFSNGKYHMFFGYKYAFGFRGNKERSFRIGYAWSEDLITWHRDDSKAGIEPSEEGWDCTMVAYPHLIRLDGKIYMFYSGNEVGRYGFGLAELQGELT